MAFSLIRSKGPVTGDGAILSPKQLREAIPAEALLLIQVDAAVSGKVRQIDLETGEETGPARPIDPEVQLAVGEKLLKKRLPDAKTEDVNDADRVVNLNDVPTDKEEIKRLTSSQLTRIIEAKVMEKLAAKEASYVETPRPGTPSLRDAAVDRGPEHQDQ